VTAKYKALAAVACIFIFAALWFFAGKGYDRMRSDLVIAELNAAHTAELADIRTALRDQVDERQAQIDHLHTEFAILESKYEGEKHDAEEKIAARDAALREFRSVPTVKVKNCNSLPGNNKTDSHQKRGDAETRAELDPETAIDIYNVGDYGNQAIIDLSILQDQVTACVNAGLCPFQFL
jgi:hypothetical protein